MVKQTSAIFIALLGSNTAAAAQSPAPQSPAMQQALAARTCELPKIAATAPLEQISGSNLVSVPVTVNGAPQKFLLDIGMKRPTAVSPELMAKLGLPEAFRLT